MILRLFFESASVARRATGYCVGTDHRQRKSFEANGTSSSAEPPERCNTGRNGASWRWTRTTKLSALDRVGPGTQRRREAVHVTRASDRSLATAICTIPLSPAAWGRTKASSEHLNFWQSLVILHACRKVRPSASLSSDLFGLRSLKAPNASFRGPRKRGYMLYAFIGVLKARAMREQRPSHVKPPLGQSRSLSLIWLRSPLIASAAICATS